MFSDTVALGLSRIEGVVQKSTSLSKRTFHIRQAASLHNSTDTLKINTLTTIFMHCRAHLCRVQQASLRIQRYAPSSGRQPPRRPTGSCKHRARGQTHPLGTRAQPRYFLQDGDVVRRSLTLCTDAPHRSFLSPAPKTLVWNPCRTFNMQHVGPADDVCRLVDTESPSLAWPHAVATLLPSDRAC